MVRKPKGPTARRRAAKRRRLDKAELVEMNKARERDAYCRFPLCGCLSIRGLGHKFEVSHQEHRGMGGDPTGERTQAPLLLLLCNWRHKLAPFSIDRKTIRWVPLTEAGADGPIRWQIKVSALRDILDIESSAEWLTIAEEIAPHVRQPLSYHMPILRLLSEMRN